MKKIILFAAFILCATSITYSSNNNTQTTLTVATSAPVVASYGPEEVNENLRICQSMMRAKRDLEAAEQEGKILSRLQPTSQAEKTEFRTKQYLNLSKVKTLEGIFQARRLELKTNLEKQISYLNLLVEQQNNQNTPEIAKGSSNP